MNECARVEYACAERMKGMRGMTHTNVSPVSYAKYFNAGKQN